MSNQIAIAPILLAVEPILNTVTLKLFCTMHVQSLTFALQLSQFSKAEKEERILSLISNLLSAEPSYESSLL